MVLSGDSLKMLVMHAQRLANTQASRSRQDAQAMPKGLLRLLSATVTRNQYRKLNRPTKGAHISTRDKATGATRFRKYL